MSCRARPATGVAERQGCSHPHTPQRRTDEVRPSARVPAEPARSRACDRQAKRRARPTRRQAAAVPRRDGRRGAHRGEAVTAGHASRRVCAGNGGGVGRSLLLCRTCAARGTQWRQCGPPGWRDVRHAGDAAARGAQTQACGLVAEKSATNACRRLLQGIQCMHASALLHPMHACICFSASYACMELLFGVICMHGTAVPAHVEAYHACRCQGRPETEDVHARKCPSASSFWPRDIYGHQVRGRGLPEADAGVIGRERRPSEACFVQGCPCQGFTKG
eukprot:355917-Chlamydomonas_euryale.AAC.1